jgi:YD repeat-containing protein
MHHIFQAVTRKLRTLLVVCVLAFAACLAWPTAMQAQQGSTSRYVYDDTGRLRAVISPTGEAVVYEYDPAGNVTNIRRLTGDSLEIFNFSPQEGQAGDLVTLTGVGFGTGINQVSFNGAAARVVQVTPNTVIAEVPSSATTGPITVTTTRGSATTRKPFNIVPRITVSPASSSLLPSGRLQFTAAFPPANTGPTGGGDFPPQALDWSVNGIIGGDQTVGTISVDGLYSAPLKSIYLVRIRATSTATPALYGEARVTVFNSNAIQTPYAAVSVRREPLYPYVPRSDGVSVRNGYANVNGTAYRANVSVTTGPLINAVSPVQGTRGTTLTLTITGANLNGATSLRFLNGDNGAIDTNLTASNLNVNASGTSLTATVVINTGAGTGPRIVVVSAPAGDSSTSNPASHTLTVVP